MFRKIVEVDVPIPELVFMFILITIKFLKTPFRGNWSLCLIQGESTD